MEGFNEGSCNTIAVFVDLAKAFDSIDRDILISKLPSFGITNNLLELFARSLTKG